MASRRWTGAPAWCRSPDRWGFCCPPWKAPERRDKAYHKAGRPPSLWYYPSYPEGFDAYGYPSELFKLDMERLGIAAKREQAKVIDFAQYIENNRGTND